MIKIFTLFILFCAVSAGELSRRRSGKSKDWDIILFTQNWPVSECIQWRQDKPGADCNLASEWTVHGMWPTKLGTKGPGFCNKSLKFDISQVDSILNELTKRWLSVHSGENADESFWSHEWEKHGSCAVALDSLNSEMKYFSQGLQWNQQYSFSSILQQIGLTPGGSAQTIDDIYNGVQSILGTNPFISCHKGSEKYFLLDIRICFDKTLSLVDCDGVQRREDEHPLTQDCPEDTPIYYPQSNQLDNLDELENNYLPDDL